MYNEHDFTWFKPRRTSRMAINIRNETDFNLNAALASELPNPIGIGCIADKKVIALRSDDTGHAFPKSGRLKLPEMIEALTSNGMLFPARFTVIREGDMWIGTLDSQPDPKEKFKNPPHRKKKPDLASLAKEAAKL